jgi:hypothetical protein
MFPVGYAFSGGNRACGRGGPPDGLELVDLQKGEAGTSQAQRESRRTLAGVSGEAPAKLRGGYRPVSGNGPPEWRGPRNEWPGFPKSQAGRRKATETRKTDEPRYADAGGTRVRVTSGTSVQPSICWQVRIQMAVPVFGTPCRAT